MSCRSGRRQLLLSAVINPLSFWCHVPLLRCCRARSKCKMWTRAESQLHIQIKPSQVIQYDEDMLVLHLEITLNLCPLQVLHNVRRNQTAVSFVRFSWKAINSNSRTNCFIFNGHMRGEAHLNLSIMKERSLKKKNKRGHNENGRPETEQNTNTVAEQLKQPQRWWRKISVTPLEFTTQQIVLVWSNHRFSQTQSSNFHSCMWKESSS